MTHESWRSELLDYGQELPSLKGLRIESIVIDSLHTAELGITAHVIGNISKCAYTRPHLLLKQLAKTAHQRCHWEMLSPVRFGMGAAASWALRAIGLSIAGAVLHSAGF